jgi:UDP-N-acetylmuramoyl-tripeptide--D-alanyl-D-alanine ligase
VAADAQAGLCYRFTLSFGGQYARVILNIPGIHAVTTALAAASVAISCGMSAQAVAAGLGEIRPAKRRGEIKEGINTSTLVDDSYNANRQSAEAALKLLSSARLALGRKRWFIFGDMLQLGKYSRDEHASVGRSAALAVDELVLVGTEVKATASSALEAGLGREHIHLFPAALSEPAALAAARMQAAVYTREHLESGDLVLVKGSLGVGMDAVVAELQEKPPGHRVQADITTRLQLLTQVQATLAAGDGQGSPSNGTAVEAPYSVELRTKSRTSDS